MTNNKKTYCRICEPACALVAQVNEDVIKLVPDRDHPIHQGFCCHKVQLLLSNFLNGINNCNKMKF